MTKLQYLGARELKFTDPRFDRTYDFTSEDKTCEVEDGHAEIIMLESPRGFKVVSKTAELLTDDLEDSAALAPEKPAPDLESAPEKPAPTTETVPVKPELEIKT